MKKRLIYFGSVIIALAIVSVIVWIFAVNYDGKTDDASSDYSAEASHDNSGYINRALDKYLNLYEKNGVSDFREVIGLYSIGADFSLYSFDGFLSAETDGDFATAAQYVIGFALYQKMVENADDTKYSAAKQFITETIESEEFLKSSTENIYLAILACRVSLIDADKSRLFDELNARSVALGGFYSGHIVGSGDNVTADMDSTAMVLIAYSCYPQYRDDFEHDGALLYIKSKINDDFTVNNKNNEKSSVSTSLTLNALLCSNIAGGGQLSRDLSDAIDTFSKKAGTLFLGLSDQSFGEVDIKATAEAFSALCFTVNPPIWKLFE